MNKSHKVEFSLHKAETDRNSIHRAVAKASKNKDFIIKTVEQLESMKFPAYKYQILDYATRNSVDKDVVSLLRSLDDKMLYQSKYKLKKALEQENTNLKQKNQITDKTRKNLNVQSIDRRQKRHDYPETPATAMKNYICDLCGKEFQSRDQLLDHQEFEYKNKKTK
jgi:hypothetical protein